MEFRCPTASGLAVLQDRNGDIGLHPPVVEPGQDKLLSKSMKNKRIP